MCPLLGGGGGIESDVLYFLTMEKIVIPGRSILSLKKKVGSQIFKNISLGL